MQIEPKLVGTFSVKSSATTQAHSAVPELRLSICQRTSAVTHSWWRDGITNEVLVERFHTNQRYHCFNQGVYLGVISFLIFDCTCVGGTHRTDPFADVTCYRRWAPLKHLMFPFFPADIPGFSLVFTAHMEGQVGPSWKNFIDQNTIGFEKNLERWKLPSSLMQDW